MHTPAIYYLIRNLKIKHFSCKKYANIKELSLAFQIFMLNIPEPLFSNFLYTTFNIQLKTGCIVPRRSRNEISFGCKCSNFYNEGNLICKQFIMIIIIF